MQRRGCSEKVQTATYLISFMHCVGSVGHLQPGQLYTVSSWETRPARARQGCSLDGGGRTAGGIPLSSFSSRNVLVVCTKPRRVMSVTMLSGPFQQGGSADIDDGESASPPTPHGSGICQRARWARFVRFPSSRSDRG
jgi:hypothetical protein